MTALSRPSPTPPTLDAMAEGVRLTLPMVPGLLIAAGAVGAAAAEKGVSLGEAALMSFLVYAGASQLLALQMWPQEWTPAALATLVVVTVAVNLRMLLMGAALQPYLSRGLPRGTPYLALAMLTDGSFVISSRYTAEGGRDAGVFLGAGLFMWVIWVAATVPGHMLGHVLADPRRLGLDLITPLLFTVMAVGLFRARRDRLVWPLAAVVAVIVAQFVEGYWFIIAGALTGSLAAGVFRRHD